VQQSTSENALRQSLNLQSRSRHFALDILKLFRELPHSDDARIIGKQVLRSAMSLAANYRAACRARSRQEFAAKMGTALEEADETLFWLEIIVEGKIMTADRVQAHIREAGELVAIFSASRATARKNLSRPSTNR
jgi:four helix bundle protein